MAWITTDDGRRVNTDWFSEDERKKYADIERNQKEAAERNGKSVKTYKEVPVKGLIYGTAVFRNNHIDVDGYINKKSESAMLTQFANAIEKLGEDGKREADGLRDLVKWKEFEQIHPNRNDGPDQFILEWEDVPGASWFNEEKDEMEYKPAKYYVHMRFAREH